MLNIRDSIEIRATAAEAMQLYVDIQNWPHLFPATILSARIIAKEVASYKVEVTHRYEGKVINQVTLLKNNEVRLEEFKPKYNAVFINRFIEMESGCSYQIEASIQLKGIFKLAQYFIRTMVRNRIKSFLLLPVKQFAEKRQAN